MKIAELTKILESEFEVKRIELEDTEKIPHIGIIFNGEIIDLEHDYNTLYSVLEIYTGETDEMDSWNGKKYLFLFSQDGEVVSDFKLMGMSDRLTDILFD